LNTSGLNAQVRHPLYFGTLLALWGTFLLYPTDASLLVAGVSTLYLLIGSKLEERKLEQQFGDAYRSYQRKVPMLIPFKWRHSKN
jgi:protein-S-isoprenylcysteine O-methyltransferase Ste14